MSIAKRAAACNASCADQTRHKRYNRLRAWFRFLGADKSLYARDLKPTFTLTNPHIYSKQQITAILAQASDRGELAVRLGYQCGFRKQEIEHAMYREIGWENCTISVSDKRWSDIYPAEKARKVQERVKVRLAEAEKAGRVLRLDPVWAFRVKDAEERAIPVPAEFLEKLRARQAMHSNDHLIVPNSIGSPDQSLLATIKGLAKKAGLGTAGVDLHTLRRTWMTTLIRNGVDIRTVQHLTGHAKLETTLRYLRPTEGEEQHRCISKKVAPLAPGRCAQYRFQSSEKAFLSEALSRADEGVNRARELPCF